MVNDEKRRSVLLVEDEGYVTEILDKIFARFHPRLDILHATNAQEARKMLEEHRPDLVILDIYIPGASGLELLQAAKQKNPKVCAIVITGSTDSDLAGLGRKAIKEGAWDFVVKPAELDRIGNLIELWLFLNPSS